MGPMGRNRIRVVSITALVLTMLIGAACKDSESSARDKFLNDMVPHHESAVAMADLALQRADHPEVKQLAQNIKQDQQREIDQMHRLLGDKASKNSSGGHGGMNTGSSGESDLAKLQKTLQPFDQAFIDAMIPHHEAAIKMAKDVKGKSGDKEVDALADAIITAQEREIAQMKEWRKQWYGS